MTQGYPRTDLSQKAEVQRGTMRDWQQSGSMRAEAVFINFAPLLVHVNVKMMLYDDAYTSTSRNYTY